MQKTVHDYSIIGIRLVAFFTGWPVEAFAGSEVRAGSKTIPISLFILS